MNWVRIGGAFAFVGVALGAFGAHGLKELLEQNQTADIWDTASLYHLIHAVTMILPATGQGRFAPAAFFSVGIIIFSGSLYLLAITGMSWLGAITPLGGLAFLAGWAKLVWSETRAKAGST